MTKLNSAGLVRRSRWFARPSPRTRPCSEFASVPRSSPRLWARRFIREPPKKSVGFPSSGWLARILSSTACPIALRHYTGMARHSICLTRQRFSPTAKLRRLRRLQSARSRITVSHGGDRGKCASAPQGAAHEIGYGVFEQQPGTILNGLSQCASLRPLLHTVLDRLTGFAGRGNKGAPRE